MDLIRKLKIWLANTRRKAGRIQISWQSGAVYGIYIEEGIPTEESSKARV